MKMNFWKGIGVAIALSTLVATTACAGQQASTETAPTAPSATAPAASEAPLTTTAAPGLSGTFVAAEHPTTGTVRIIEEDGMRYLEFDAAFKTDPGPDLTVVLHQAEDILAVTQSPAYPLQEGEYVVIEELQSTEGTQRYAIPPELNLADYSSVGIWCRQFNATFGAASLQS
ncbi:DM13 domain-containing protein [Pseudanabaena sp. FACHB-2040]|uniref:DM13 domain-containing protein n=1 Tax=Pseudanabaena sp. FACHB-2040 TaxID=2692859 RepID=UPI0016887C8A|nr:DM13 domain-containing protein [Pseudanabaena sp. FACHB-2040]MBD2256056.1 DM13 domain-containing protein [Pseudanabaena sp. FACHB-2040]